MLSKIAPIMIFIENDYLCAKNILTLNVVKIILSAITVCSH
jgi:hypothetical protein